MTTNRCRKHHRASPLIGRIAWAGSDGRWSGARFFLHDASRAGGAWPAPVGRVRAAGG
jgi:hypothetical protein